ncbi:GumM protein [Terrihabitans soli]|uniref:GumM protein n=1 Tax=Terrihabitans soli TaxID=708113 RepID=A0A6S6QQT3_9HYPH|nr:WecB/TagA/CpsF family glycosyltransferase [Terrihabitans soli]BCJ91926.1 GumM protein [Terrihabitans soli]
MAARRQLAGFLVSDTRADALTRLLQRRLRRHEQTLLFFANHHFVVECQHLREDMQNTPSIIVNDGIAMNAASLLLFGRRFRENLNGTDFTPRFLKALARPANVYLFGSEAQVVAEAGELFGALPHVNVVGTCDGFSYAADERDLVADINRSGADIVLVGLGNPRQEEWVLRHAAQLDAKLIVCIGALFEWATGHKRRAPAAIRKCGMEWAYRICLEPKRLTRRYTVGAVAFFVVVARDRLFPIRTAPA